MRSHEQQQQPQVQQKRQNHEFIVAGYLPDYCTHVNITSASQYLTDLILFSIQPTPKGELNQCCLKPHQIKAAQTAAAASSNNNNATNTRIWVTIGGMQRSQAFPQLLLERQHRLTFLENLLAFCKENINFLYGVNLYWDDPKTRQDLNAYSQLILDTATVLHEHGILLSLTTRQFFSKNVIDKVDFINLLAFDLIPKSAGAGPGDVQRQHQHHHHHAAMESVTMLVDNVLHQGDIPPHKLILGIPAYARHQDDPANVRTFAELVEDGYRELTQSSYKGYLFDSPGRVKRKVKFAKKRGLGGVFLWELGQDKQVRGAPGGMLLEAIAVGQYTTELLRDEL